MQIAKLMAIIVVTAWFAIVSVAPVSESAAFPNPQVYKTPTCSCCSKWVSLFQRSHNGVQVQSLPDLTSIKDRYHVPPLLRSCHTTVIAGYVFEGHVPIDLIQQVLAERPGISGLAVPGMPVGSPGMEMQGRKDAYKVIAFKLDGATFTYAER